MEKSKLCNFPCLPSKLKLTAAAKVSPGFQNWCVGDNETVDCLITVWWGIVDARFLPNWGAHLTTAGQNIADSVSKKVKVKFEWLLLQNGLHDACTQPKPWRASHLQFSRIISWLGQELRGKESYNVDDEG